MAALALAPGLGLAAAGPAAGEAEPIRIGVLANRGKELCQREWQATAEYLSEKLAPRRFEIVPLGFDEFLPAVERGEVAFVSANPAYYARLEHQGLARRIATRQVPGSLGPQPRFGGVIFVRTGREDLQTLKDLRGQRFGAVDANSFGGWHAAWREIAGGGLDPWRDFAKIVFYGTHDGVVQAVLNGDVDAGTVRSTQLEQMAEENRLDPGSLRVLHSTREQHPDYPYRLSTRLYAEWPFAVLSGVPGDLSKQMAVALLMMDEDGEAARAVHSAGWGIAQDYADVHGLLRDLHLPPFEHHDRIGLGQVVRQYGWGLAAMALLLLVLTGGGLALARANRALRKTQAQLTEANGRLNAAIGRANDLATQADAANAAKSALLAAVSHDIRTPMNAIICFADLLAGELAEPRQRQQAEVIARSGKSLLRLINDLLDLSKIEAGRLEIHPARCSLRHLLREVQEVFALLAREKGIDLSVTFGDSLPACLLIDEGRVRQILVNLAGNAIKFTESGWVSIHADVAHPPAAEADRGDVVFSVTDTGPGIPEDFKARLFEAFEQNPGQNRARYGGTGLGLAISRQLARLMGGDIAVSENPGGKGSVFRLFLRNVPLCDALPEPPGPDARAHKVAEDQARAATVSGEVPGRVRDAALLAETAGVLKSLRIRQAKALGEKLGEAGGPDELVRLGRELCQAAEGYQISQMISVLNRIAAHAAQPDPATPPA